MFSFGGPRAAEGKRKSGYWRVIMKRLINLICLLVALSLTWGVVITAEAAEAPKLTVTAAKSVVCVGDSVRVTVGVDRAVSGIFAFQMDLEYDHSLFVFAGAKMEGSRTYDFSDNKGSKGETCIRIMVLDRKGTHVLEGNFITLEFKALKTGSGTFGLTNVVFAKGNGDAITVTLKPGVRVRAEAESMEMTPMYRLYNPNSGEHFYTGSEEERDSLVKVGWNYEGIAWSAPVKEGFPVYRLFNPNAGDHHYTGSMTEVENLVAVGWQYEGVCWNSPYAGIPVHRVYNPNAISGTHHYTPSEEEVADLIEAGWLYEQVAWNGVG